MNRSGTFVRPPMIGLPFKPACEAFVKADKIVVGAGAGLSASAGLDYNDRSFFASNYKPFLKTGCKTVSECINHFWHLSRDNAASYWGFWAWHINHIYYSQEQQDTYKLLYELVRERNYFIITTNTDGQFFKGGFDPEKVFAVQGSDGRVQCRHGCHRSAYENEVMIQSMLESFDQESLCIGDSEIPVCPVCGKLMSPNLRVDQHFVDTPYREGKRGYGEFVDALNENILFLELGENFDTPALIREPFEEMTELYKNSQLVRIDITLSDSFTNKKNKTFAYSLDIHQFLKMIRERIAI